MPANRSWHPSLRVEKIAIQKVHKDLAVEKERPARPSILKLADHSLPTSKDSGREWSARHGGAGGLRLEYFSNVDE